MSDEIAGKASFGNFH